MTETAADMNYFVPNRKAPRMTGAQKSAILFLCMGEERGGALMQQLDVSEIQKITQAISNMGEVEAELVEEIMQEFGQKVNAYGGVTGNIDAARGLLKEFLPEERVGEILNEIEGSSTGNVWNELSDLDEKLLAGFLRKEHDQTVAVILSNIRADAAARILPLLGAERSAVLVERMLDASDISSDALKSIEETLRREILAKASNDSGGRVEKQLVSVFNNLDESIFQDLSRELGKSIPDQFQSIKSKMFVFDDLKKLQPNALAKVMREIDAKTLPLALRGAKKEVREHFLSSLPARSRDMLQEEMEALGAVRSSDVKQAQSDVLEAAFRLAGEGEIEMPSDDDEDMIE
ncbi:MAG: flagellar motor switch protein FliG [Brevirhabdus sp.]